MRLLLLLGIFILLYGKPVFAADVEFIFAYDTQEGFPAFMGSGQDIPDINPGTYIEILRLVELRLPIKLTLQRLPWERCKAYLKLNRVSGINSSYRKSREDIGVFPYSKAGLIDDTRRITSDTYRIYALKHSEIFYDFHSRKITNIGKGLVAPLGYSIVADLKKAGIPIEQNPAGVESLLRMIALGRAEGAIAHESQTSYLLDKFSDEFSGIKAVDPPLAQKNYFILIGKDFYLRHPLLSEQIWDTIAELRESHLPAITARYMALDGQN